MTIPTNLRTPRLALIPATPDLAQAELNDAEAFSELLGAVVPDGWPPGELSDVRLLFLCLLEANPAWIGWLGWYAVELGADNRAPGNADLPVDHDVDHAPDHQPERQPERQPEHQPRPGISTSSGESLPHPPTLVGSVGFKGPPDKEGVVEIGYSVLPAHEGRGLATEMAAALVGWAAEQGARIVHAQVKPANPASIRVLEKLGFQETGIGDEPGTLLFAREAGRGVAHPEVDEGAPGWTQLEAVHREVDEGARALEAIHRDRLRCSLGCCFCCIDEITVFEIEANRIQRHNPELLATGEPHPVGGCAFLDDDGVCRIYEHRPYVCRTQGLPLRWEDETPAGEPAELRDICPLNESGRPIEALPAEECWEIGPFEERLGALQAARDGGRLARIRLRDIFARRAPDPGATQPSPAS